MEHVCCQNTNQFDFNFSLPDKLEVVDTSMQDMNIATCENRPSEFLLVP